MERRRLHPQGRAIHPARATVNTRGRVWAIGTGSGGGLVAEEGLEDAALLPGLDEELLLLGVPDGADEALALGLLEVTLEHGAQAGHEVEGGAPGGGALAQRVQGAAVALGGAPLLLRAQVQARLVVTLTVAAARLRIVAGLVVDVTEVAASSHRPQRAGCQHTPAAITKATNRWPWP